MVSPPRFLATIAFLIASIVMIGVGTAMAETLRIQSLDGPGSIATRGLERLADTLRSESGGAIDIVVLPVRSAVGPAATLDAMRSGAIDGHYSSPAYFAATDPGFALLGDTLALYPDPETRDRWYTENGGLDLARALYADHGVHLVGFVYWPEEWLVAGKPASILADLDGLNIRAPTGPVSELVSRIGAEPVPLSGRDTLKGLDNGSIDAADWASLPVNLRAGAHRDARYAIRARHSMPVTEISVSKKAWKRLSPAARRLFERRVAAFSKSQRAVFEAANVSARAVARGQGVTLLEMSPSSLTKLRGESMEVFEERGQATEITGEIAASHRNFLERLGLIEATKPDLPMPAEPESDGSG